MDTIMVLWLCGKLLVHIWTKLQSPFLLKRQPWTFSVLWIVEVYIRNPRLILGKVFIYLFIYLQILYGLLIVKHLTCSYRPVSGKTSNVFHNSRLPPPIIRNKFKLLDITWMDIKGESKERKKNQNKEKVAGVHTEWTEWSKCFLFQPIFLLTWREL